MIPFVNRKPFYGWIMVVGLGIVGAMTVAMGGIVFGLFITPMSEELAINQAYFGWAQTARFIGFAISGWLIGHLLDRYGSRVPLAIASTLLAFMFVGLSIVQQGWQLVAIFFFMGVIGIQGVGGNLYASVPIAKWFVRKRGKAMSMMFLGVPVGLFVLSPLSQYVIDTFGWRAAWSIIGIGGGGVMVLVALLVLRNRPEDMGLLPDGDSVEDSEGVETNSGPSPARLFAEYSWTRAQALGDSTFWRLSLVIGFRAFSSGTIGLFRIPFYIESGVNASVVALALSAEAIAIVFASIPVGWALDRAQPRFVAILPFTALSASVMVTMNISRPWHVFAATMLFGVGAASFAVLENTIWPHYFGGQHVGSIRGAALPLTIAFSAAGAPIAGMYKDAFGTFFPVWWASLALLMAGMILLIFTPKPATPEPETPPVPVAIPG